LTLRQVCVKMTKAMALLIFLRLLAAALADLPPVAGPTVTVTPEITVEEVISHIAYLASDRLAGREAGTAECEEASHYLAGRFREYGLAPAGEGGTFYQTFQFPSGVRLREGNRLVVRLGSEERAGTVGADFLPLACSANGTARGEVVLAGYGIRAPELSYDDFAGLDMAGKIGLVLRLGPEGNQPRGRFGRYLSLRSKARLAQQQGAVGVLFFTGTGQDEGQDLGGVRFDGRGPGGIPAAVIRREWGLALLGCSAERLAQWENRVAAGLRAEAGSSPREPPGVPSLQVPPGVTAELRCDLETIQSTTANLLGTVEGSDPTLRQQAICLGAHYDHVGISGGEVCNGADDNASGTAGLLELAQYFAAHRQETRRTLLFAAFSGEEKGFLGSEWYVHHPSIPLEQTVAMLNLDMIGRSGDGTVRIGGVGTSPQWAGLLEAAAASGDLKVQTSTGSQGGSDHEPFYRRNIPVLHFYTGMHSDYHRPTDDWDKINAAGEVQILRLVVALIHRLNTCPEGLSFAPLPGDSETAEGFR